MIRKNNKICGANTMIQKVYNNIAWSLFGTSAAPNDSTNTAGNHEKHDDEEHGDQPHLRSEAAFRAHIAATSVIVERATIRAAGANNRNWTPGDAVAIIRCQNIVVEECWHRNDRD